VTPNAFRKMALALPGVEERAHMKHPDFRVHNKIFASLGFPDKEWGMAKIPAEHQLALTKAHPKVYVPAAGAWGRAGCTLVHLPQADAETVGEALTAAWRSIPVPSAKRAVKKRAAKR
jgi:hypothetical protein